VIKLKGGERTRKSHAHRISRWLMTGLVSLAPALAGTAQAQAQQAKKLNILIIWGDEIGYWNVSAYTQVPGPAGV